MARLKAQADILYYPTAESIVRLIATWFSNPARSRLADPCCGKGEALATFAQAVGGESETWGVEISYSRADEAQRVLDVVLPASFYAVNWGQRTVSLAFENPPYDWSSTRDEHGKHLRHEWLFVSQMTPRIIPGGHHVTLVPRSMLGDERFARHLVGWYGENLIFRSGEDYDRFKQVVILAAHRKERYEPPTKEAIDGLTRLSDDTTTLPELVAGDGRFVIPAAPQAGRFQYQPATPEDLLRASARCEVVGSDDFRRATYVRPPGAPINVAVPEKIGHMTMEISSGEVGVLCIDTPGGSILMKGMSSKAIDESAEAQYDDEGEYSHTKVEARERLVTIITVAHPNGRLERLDKPDAVGDFITRHAGAIADALLKRNQPTYDWRPTEREWEIASHVALGLPPLPGREARGLFDAQKHFAIAAARVMRKYRQCLLNCDMGFGKTASSIGALEELDEWPALVLCPGHMVEKWRRDLERASDPDNPIAARIITRPARGEASRWHSQVVPAIEEAGGRIVDTARTQVAPVTINDPGGRRRVIVECSGSSAARLVKVLQSLCTFRDNGHTQPPTIQFTAGGLVVEFVDRDDYTLFDFAADYQAGRLDRKAVAVIAFDPAKYDAGPVPVEVRRWQRVWNEDKGTYERQHLIVCPTCGKGHSTLPWRCDNVIQEPILDASGKKTGERSRTCGAPLYEMSRWRRVGLSRLIQRKFKGLFKVYVGDEIHKCQDGRSDIGTADGRLVSTIPYGLALTGTLFGGTGGSLFYLLYRRNVEVRRLYRYKDKTRWVDHYGLWKMTWSQNEPLAAGRGLSTGIERWNYRQDELPGVSPAVIRFLLPITLFGKITDLGYSLPPLHEHIERLKMPKALKKQYEETDRQLLSEAMRLAMQDHDPGGLSIWFATMRFRPASAYRDEVAAYDSKRGRSIHVELPAVTGPDLPWLPKEVRLAEIVRRNRERGRKTLVFVEQSGTRDIRPRLQQALEVLVPGGADDTALAEVDTSHALLQMSSDRVMLNVPIRVGTLSSGDMSPAKRETWIALEAPNMDALLVNPKLIETGLDLLTFSHVVFLELNVSLYTLWQAQRRVWRLGQRNEVDVTFLVYKDTIEEALLQRMGAKMKHAMLLYGDEASGSLIEADDDDLQREMIRAALEGKTYETVGELVNGIFTTSAESTTAITDSPMGSPVAMSPHMPVLNIEEVLQLDLFGGHARAMEVIVANRKRRR